ncbi:MULTISPECIES: peptide ABC transporter substrate-binding protein [Candidatus Rhabdochlamydia]|nr:MULTISPECIES: peptide ABC transporter substrate-binding protein [Rhabdochlamydia]
MDPRKGGEQYSSQMHFLFFEGLVKLYPDGSIKLAQAESYELSEDNLQITFHLRDTVWSNNTPVTAYDFEQSWKDILDPKFPSLQSNLFSPIKNADAAKQGLIPLDEVGIKAIDAKTLRITLDKPTPYLFKLLACSSFSPVNIKNDRQNSNWADHAGLNFLCNGPYLLEKWDHENQIIAISNPHYRKTQDLRPKKIIFNVIKNDQITLQMFEKGLIDVIGDSLTSIPLDAVPSLEKKWTISRKPRASTLLITLNTEKFPFNHPKIRRAFGLAINRQELIGSFGKGIKKSILADYINIAYQASMSATNLVPPCLKENRHRSFFKDNDVVQAKTFLEEAMVELGISREIFDSVILYYYSRTFGADELMQKLQQQWLNALDIFIKIEYLDSKTIMDKLIKGDYHMCFMRRDALYNDPMSVLERFKYKDYIKNYSNWENQEYIRLLDKSFYEQSDARSQILEQAERIFLNEMPVIPLYHEDYIYIINPNLKYKVPLSGDRLLLPLSFEDQGC